jgi:predicted DNA binding CopG/RHH family protein
MKDRGRIWVDKNTHNELKARASKEGLTLQEYMKRLASNSKDEGDKLDKYKGGWFG